MSVGEVIQQLLQAREHTDRAKAMIRAALEEMGRADVLVRQSLRGASDQTLAALAERIRQHLGEAGRVADGTMNKIDETVARYGGSGGSGNW